MRGGKRPGAGRKKDLSVTDIHIKIKTKYLDYIMEKDNVPGENRNKKINYIIGYYIEGIENEIH